MTFPHLRGNTRMILPCEHDCLRSGHRIKACSPDARPLAEISSGRRVSVALRAAHSFGQLWKPKKLSTLNPKHKAGAELLRHPASPSSSYTNCARRTNKRIDTAIPRQARHLGRCGRRALLAPPPRIVQAHWMSKP